MESFSKDYIKNKLEAVNRNLEDLQDMSDETTDTGEA